MEADRALFELAAARHHLVDLEMVRHAGLTPRQWQWRVKSGEWLTVVPGVWRHVATPETFELRVRAGAHALGRDAALAGAAAAAWWGLDGFGDDEERVVFAVPRDRRWRGSVHVRTTREWKPTDLLWRNGVRVTNVTRLILDSGGESALERRFLRLMRSADLPRPRPQVAYERESARAMRVDFQFANGLVVEVSGRLGHTSDRDRQHDARRRNALQLKGVSFVEFTTADVVDDPAYVICTVADLLR